MSGWHGDAPDGKNRTCEGHGHRVAGDGSVRRAVVDTAGRDNAARWEQLIDQAGLGVRPPYRPRPGEAIYHIRAGELAVQVAERDT